MIELLRAKPPVPCFLADYYYDLLEKIGLLKRNYSDYLITEPIICDEELKRIPEADLDLCGALLTMLLREDHFVGYGCFDRRVENGDVARIVDRMCEILKNEDNRAGAET